MVRDRVLRPSHKHWGDFYHVAYSIQLADQNARFSQTRPWGLTRSEDGLDCLDGRVHLLKPGAQLGRFQDGMGHWRV